MDDARLPIAADLWLMSLNVCHVAEVVPSRRRKGEIKMIEGLIAGLLGVVSNLLIGIAGLL